MEVGEVYYLLNFCRFSTGCTLNRKWRGAENKICIYMYIYIWTYNKSLKCKAKRPGRTGRRHMRWPNQLSLKLGEAQILPAEAAEKTHTDRKGKKTEQKTN